jgi:hypothetical protein
MSSLHEDATYQDALARSEVQHDMFLLRARLHLAEEHARMLRLELARVESTIDKYTQIMKAITGGNRG